MVEPARLGLSPRLGIDFCIFLNLYQDLTRSILLVVCYVLIDSEMRMITLSISRIAGSVSQEGGENRHMKTNGWTKTSNIYYFLEADG